MTELLTREEYAAIAADLDLPAAPFIDGKFRKGNGPVMETVNPATGEVLKKISTANAEDVDFAVKKAREAFDRGEWSRAHPSERKDVLIRFCKLITRRRHELAVMESLDSGKPIRDCETIDVPETIHTIKWHGELIASSPLGPVPTLIEWDADIPEWPVLRKEAMMADGILDVHAGTDSSSRWRAALG